jgi:hypothetical protein
MEPVTTTLIFLVVGIVFLFIFLYFVPINLWITAIFSGVRVGLFELVFMRIRKVPPGIMSMSGKLSQLMVCLPRRLIVLREAFILSLPQME